MKTLPILSKISNLGLKKIIGICIYYSGLFYLLELIEKLTQNNGLIILSYHRVINPLQGFDFDKNVISATPINFEKQVKFLVKKYNIISFDALIDYVQSKTKLPKNPLIITFDDGYKDNHVNAYPVLLKYSVPATFFLATEYIDKNHLPWWDEIAYIINKTKIKKFKLEDRIYYLNSKKGKTKTITEVQKRLKEMDDVKKEKTLKKIRTSLKVNVDKKISKDLFLSWENIKEMNKNHMSFGAHTLTHCNLARVSLEKAKKEIVQSKLKIEKKLDEKVEVFSYPYGGLIYFNNRIKAIVKDGGCFCAVSTKFGVNETSNKLDIFSLNRIDIQNQDNIFFFKLKLNRLIIEFYFLLKKLKRKLIEGKINN